MFISGLLENKRMALEAYVVDRIQGMLTVIKQIISESH